jgi:hypothetical protein
MRRSERERELRPEVERGVVPSSHAEPAEAQELASSLGNSASMALARRLGTQDELASGGGAPSLGTEAFAPDRAFPPGGFGGGMDLVGHELTHVQQQREGLGEKPPPDDYQLPSRDPSQQVVGMFGAYASEEERVQKEEGQQPSIGELTIPGEGKAEEDDEGVPGLSLGYFRG